LSGAPPDDGVFVAVTLAVLACVTRFLVVVVVVAVATDAVLVVPVVDEDLLLESHPAAARVASDSEATSWKGNRGSLIGVVLRPLPKGS
jgi:hypothetical protein